jgi:isopenicillin N synthase-like dioxygenase
MDVASSLPPTAPQAEAMNSIPVIDIAPLVKGSLEEARATATAIGTACREVGFF